jgi:hypothetical protein
VKVHVRRAASLFLASLACACMSCEAIFGIGDLPSCAPHPVTATPAWVPPVNAKGSCTAQQIADYYAACSDPNAPSGACDAWMNPANATCQGCLVTDSGASAYGVLISYPGYGFINVAGCIWLADVNQRDCAQSIAAFNACQVLACNTGADGNCPFPSTSFADVQSCQRSAAVCPTPGSCACSSYADREACLDSVPDPAMTACGLHQGVQAQFFAVATFMCGP